MLSWWSGAGEREGDETHEPATPAPVFAARAFKSAIFGTPHPNDDISILPVRDHPPPGRRTSRDDLDTMSQPTRRSDSPTKPQGILLTPGTVGRRKTVSFGVGVVDNEGKKAAGMGKSGLPNDFPGKFPSPWTPKVIGLELAKPSRETALNKLLEGSREKKKPARSTELAKAPIVFEPSKRAAVVEIVSDGEDDITDSREGWDGDVGLTLTNGITATNVTKLPDHDGDLTFDLNNPHSQSGQYWKSEYERYHHEALEEMRKLVKYKQLAKSFARKKDGEAIDLGQKLREEQRKVALMEQKVARLTTQIAAKRLDSVEGEESPELRRQLVKQTTLTVRYRDEVDQFQSAMLERLDGTVVEEQHATSPRTAQTLLEVSQELKRAREQLKEMKTLRSELHSMKLTASAAERKSTKLSDDNSRLKRDLEKAREEIAKSEGRQQAAERHAKEQEKKYNDLKDVMSTKKVEAEALLKTGHDEKTALRQELRALKRDINTANASRIVEPPTPRATTLEAPKAAGLSRRGRTDDRGGQKETEICQTQAKPTTMPDDVKPLVPPKDDKPARTNKSSTTKTKGAETDQAGIPRETADKSHGKPELNPRTKQAAALTERNNNSQSPFPATQTSRFPPLCAPPLLTTEFSLPKSGNKVYDFKLSREKPTSMAIDKFEVQATTPRHQTYPQVRVRTTSKGRHSMAKEITTGVSDLRAMRSSPKGVTPRKMLSSERAEAAKRRLEQRNALKKRSLELAECSGVSMIGLR